MKPIDAILANFLLNALIIVVSAALLFFMLAWFLDIRPEFPDVLKMILILLMLTLTSLGIGMLITVYGVFFESIPRAIHISTKPLLFISAILYSANDLPKCRAGN